MAFDLYLASQSPRRSQLLHQLGVQFKVQVADIDERILAQESAYDYVARLALQKAQAVWDRLDSTQQKPVLAADTCIAIENEILGKPADEQMAKAMLQRLAGRVHQVYTGIALVSQQHSVCVNVNQVSFRPITEQEIHAYWQTGEPQGKAGGYAIQGYGAAFIAHLEGSYSGVMGLPLFETAQLLDQYEIPIWQIIEHE